MVVNFRRSVITAELCRPKVARFENFVSNFCVFLVKRPLTVKFSKFCSESLHCLTEIVRYLPDKYISTVSQTVATAQMAPKICQGQPPTMCSQCSRFHPNPFTFGGVTAARVNTVFCLYIVSIIRSKLRANNKRVSKL